MASTKKKFPTVIAEQLKDLSNSEDGISLSDKSASTISKKNGRTISINCKPMSGLQSQKVASISYNI